MHTIYYRINRSKYYYPRKETSNWQEKRRTIALRKEECLLKTGSADNLLCSVRMLPFGIDSSSVATSTSKEEEEEEEEEMNSINTINIQTRNHARSCPTSMAS